MDKSKNLNKSKNPTSPESPKKQVFSGVLWKFSESSLAQIISFVVSLVIARFLAPGDYGVIAIVTIFINIANVFVVSGLPVALIQKKDATDIDFNSIFWVTLGISLIVYIILVLLTPFISDFYQEPLLKSLMPVLGLRLILSSYNSVQHAYVSRNMQFKKFFFSTFAGTVISGVIGVYCACNGFGAWALVIQYMVNSCVDSIFLSFTIGWFPKFSFSKTAAAPLFNYGWKLLAADLSGTFFNELRGLLIGKVYTSADLAFYNRGQNFPGLIVNNIQSAINSVLFPNFANISDDLLMVKQQLRKSVEVTSYLLTPLLIGLAAVATPLVTILLTDKWLPCVPYIQILSLSSLFGLIGSPSLQTLKALGHSGEVLKLEIIKKPVYILLLIVGLQINTFAIAITLTLYNLYGTLVNAHCLNRFIKYSIWEMIKDLLPAFMLTGVASSIGYFAQIFAGANIVGLIVQIIISGIVYVSLSALTKNRSFCYVLSYLRGK